MTVLDSPDPFSPATQLNNPWWTHTILAFQEHGLVPVDQNRWKSVNSHLDYGMEVLPGLTLAMNEWKQSKFTSGIRLGFPDSFTEMLDDTDSFIPRKIMRYGWSEVCTVEGNSEEMKWLSLASWLSLRQNFIWAGPILCFRLHGNSRNSLIHWFEKWEKVSYTLTCIITQ